MTVAEAFLALAILCFLLAAAFWMYADIKASARRQAWRHEWPLAQSRPYDHERDAA